jgi:hypothetical protein
MVQAVSGGLAMANSTRRKPNCHYELHYFYKIVRNHKTTNEDNLTDSCQIGVMIRFMNSDKYLMIQVSTIFLLLYLDGMAFLAQHPEWFQ